MSSRKMNMLGLSLLSGVLLVLGYFAFLNDGSLVWFLPGIVAYVVDVWYWAKKPPRIVYD